MLLKLLICISHILVNMFHLPSLLYQQEFKHFKHSSVIGTHRTKTQFVLHVQCIVD